MIKFIFAVVVCILCIPGVLIAWHVISTHLNVAWH